MPPNSIHAGFKSLSSKDCRVVSTITLSVGLNATSVCSVYVKDFEGAGEAYRLVVVVVVVSVEFVAVHQLK